MKTIDDLVNTFVRLRIGIGPMNARRIVNTLLNTDDNIIQEFATKLSNLHKNVRKCKFCGMWSETDICPTCMDETRDRTILCVTDTIEDVNLIKNIDTFKGMFYVLGPVTYITRVLNGHDNNVNALIARIKRGNIKEVIFATGPSVEKGGVITYVQECLKGMNPPVNITRLAVGIPIGATLDGIDKITMTSCINNRISVKNTGF